jgi:hypothetical protein
LKHELTENDRATLAALADPSGTMTRLRTSGYVDGAGNLTAKGARRHLDLLARERAQRAPPDGPSPRVYRVRATITFYVVQLPSDPSAPPPDDEYLAEAADEYADDGFGPWETRAERVSSEDDVSADDLELAPRGSDLADQPEDVYGQPLSEWIALSRAAAERPVPDPNQAELPL